MTAPLDAEVPRQQPLGRYAELWSKSPFTVPPVATDETPPEENPLDDYALSGVCKLKEGWFVGLINKKQQDERLLLKPNEPNDEGFQVVEVEQGEGRLKTKVQIKTRSGKVGWVEYDEKFLALKKTMPQPQPGQQNPNQPPVPGRPGGGNQPQVRPPVPTPNAQNATTNNRPTRVRRVPTPPNR
jgi:hypothetical protein